MRKQRTSKKRKTKIVCVAMIAAISVSAAVSGCSKKETQPEANIETEAPMELHLSCYLTGTDTFTDIEGKEQTSVRFLIENDDRENKDWVKGINGKEYLKAGDEEIQVYSRYVNDHCRYVDGTIPGNVSAGEVTYVAGNFTSSGWEQAGDEQHHEIGAIVEDGIPYFYTGCGVSTGLAGERVMCVWLAGFTPDSIPVNGTRPQFSSTDSFSLVTADGDPVPAWEGMKKEPELSANEFGIEISIQAEDADILMRSVSHTGLILRHISEDGVVSEFELEKKVAEEAEGNMETDGSAMDAEDIGIAETADSITDTDSTVDADNTGSEETAEAESAEDTGNTDADSTSEAESGAE